MNIDQRIDDLRADLYFAIESVNNMKVELGALLVDRLMEEQTLGPIPIPAASVLEEVKLPKRKLSPHKKPGLRAPVYQEGGLRVTNNRDLLLVEAAKACVALGESEYHSGYVLIDYMRDHLRIVPGATQSIEPVNTLSTILSHSDDFTNRRGKGWRYTPGSRRGRSHRVRRSDRPTRSSPTPSRC